jgi:hypothetical protein
MNINKTNYGAWFIDYYEGTLSAEKTAELFLFLEQHPDLKAEFESFSPIILEAETAFFEEKDLLKKSAITPENIEQYLVAEIENDLNLQDKIKLKDFISANPSFTKDRELFRMTVLKPDHVEFTDKKSLRKKVAKRIGVSFNIWTAVAAVVLLILGVIYISRLDERRGTAEITPAKDNTVNDSLKDFFSSPDDVTSEIKKENLADQKTETPDKIKKHIQPQPAKERAFANNKEEKNSEPVLLAERKGINSIPVSFDGNPVEPAAIAHPRYNTYTHSNNRIPGEKETIQDRIADITDKAAEKINTATGEEILYNKDTRENPLAEKIPFKSRMLKFTAWALARISNDKIKMETTFDQSGNIAAYQVSAGKLKYEKDF